MTKFVRARCKTTGAVAALPKRALELGVFPHWEATNGPVPKRPKSAVRWEIPLADVDASAIDTEE